jgi:hypothetical protein
MTQSNYPLRLQTSLLKAVRKVAADEGTSVNQFINVAVAEKLSALRTADLFRGKLTPAERERALAILSRVGREPPREGDKPLPPEVDLSPHLLLPSKGPRRRAAKKA